MLRTRVIVNILNIDAYISIEMASYIQTCLYVYGVLYIICTTNITVDSSLLIFKSNIITYN